MAGRSLRQSPEGAGEGGDRPRSAEDIRLLRRIATGERRAFEDLYRRHHGALARFLSSLLRSPEQREEVLNDTMMAIWRRPDGFDGRSKFTTWLFAIAYRKAIRARSRFDTPVDDPGREERPSLEPGADQEVEHAQRSSLLQRAVKTLSEDHRTVVELTYFHGLGYNEIAEIMECPVDTVKSRSFYARRHLRTALAGDASDWL